MKRRKLYDSKKGIRRFFIVLFIVDIIIAIYYIRETDLEKKVYKNILSNIKIDASEITEQKTERMLQIEKLQEENNDIIGWLEIEDTNISYPVLQTTNNDFYLKHNYKKEKSRTGSLFLDKDFDLAKGSSNYLIYGHRSKNGLMFEELMKYSSEDFYRNHTKIKFTTTSEDATYEIISVFYSRVYYKSEKDVFRYYYFVNAENEQEYDEFINNAKKSSIYDIEETAQYGDQLLTLSTCEYSKADGRFVIVAKKIK